MQDYAISGNGERQWMVLFAGQGSAQPGMGADIIDRSAATRQVFECASDITGMDVRKLCLKGPMTRLTQTRYQQIAITAFNVAAVTALKEQEKLPVTACAGHSAGEYSALWLAGVFTQESLFRAIDGRAAIMQRLATENKGAMYHIQGLCRNTLSTLIGELGLHPTLQVACDNAADRQVVAGNIGAMKTLVSALLSRGIAPTKLAVNGAWHCELMAAGVAELRQLLSSLPLKAPEIAVYMNRTAQPETCPEAIIDHLAHHLTDPVRWRETMVHCQQTAQHNFLEISAKKFLLTLLDENRLTHGKYHYRDLLLPLNSV
ncbi:ACP S-malonyltransferase [Erwinia sp. 9145]|uniref:ACP S-malonyltransferase n=1 Tax=Erwinia sp. 9145 TaxID=1500895 RepID=UPI00068BC851|nr:ACP S-malonyltransferase [Erwinia sp. 9145]